VLVVYIKEGKMKLIVCITLSIFALVLLMACGDSTSPAGPVIPPLDGYFPIQVGSNWQYALSGTETDDDGDWTISGNETWSISGQSVHDEGFNVFQIDINWTITHTEVGGTFSYTENGNYTDYIYSDDNVVRWYADLSTTSYSVELDLPLSVSKTWDYIPDFPGFATISVQSLSASVTVPAGSYTQCAHLSFDYGQAPDDYLNRYYSDGTGLISQIQHVDNGTTDVWTYEYKLTTYTP